MFVARSMGIIYSCIDFAPNLHISDLPGCILAIGRFLLRVVKLWCDEHFVSALVPKKYCWHIQWISADFHFRFISKGQEATAEGFPLTCKYVATKHIYQNNPISVFSVAKNVTFQSLLCARFACQLRRWRAKLRHFKRYMSIENPIFRFVFLFFFDLISCHLVEQNLNTSCYGRIR